jgi:uncharacterized surface protein with fasciclin (FAS1) repeats
MTEVKQAPEKTSAEHLNRSPIYSLDTLARKSERLRRFADCIQAAELTHTLANKGPYTIFAPSDAAFEKIPADALQALLRDSAKLKAVLSYHIVADFIALKEMKSGELMTLQGNTLEVKLSSGVFRINGARVVETDLTAINGVVHAIDELLLPPKWRLPGIPAGASAR